MTATTLTLTDFLLARIAVDEDGRARALRDLAEVMRNQGRAATANYLEGESAQVLAECEAKRRIVELHDHDDSECFEMHRGEVAPDWPEGTGRTPGEPWSHSSLEMQEGPCPTLRALAAIYASHPDYREDWRS